MLTINEYRKNPCRALSIPYWKAKVTTLPETMKILHDSEFDPACLSEYEDVPYFRLYHPLKNIKGITLKDVRIETAKHSDIPAIVDVINRSYTDLRVTGEQILGYTKTEVYREDLWILAVEEETDQILGCGLADFDREVQEGILEWIQVLPEHWGRKIGQAIVNELLDRMKETAEFATVSGKVNDPASPELLYRKCGFTGDDVWHILQRK